MRAAPSNEERDIVRKAAQWLALLESGDASEDDHRQLQRWRDSDSNHERAWQKAQQLRQRFSGLPSKLAMATLDRPDQARRAVLKRALGIAILAPTAWMVVRPMPGAPTCTPPPANRIAGTSPTAAPCNSIPPAPPMSILPHAV